MKRHDVFKAVEETGIVAIVRGTGASDIVPIAKAMYQGGVRAIEVTMNTRGAMDMMRELSSILPKDMLLGAGTVLDPETGRAAILAGATFILSPTFSRPLVELCNRYDVMAVPGVMTPTEALTAWEAGVDVVKVFPASVLGPSYIKDLKGPLPQIETMPVGGVNLETIPAFIKAGACSVGVGGELVDKKLISACDWKGLSEKAERFTDAISEARKSK
ncbi:MAG TPA: bifunctional 4-hydroxy-2-oxoglutarate aldolase/2-dehydro-3-deoxy-phosphogluconate aldolase [Bacillota bacterium]|nr:bifunctional 4-hydroxy-2-oxoglutarate aldolase/2-dehydro-3-deoxy-phosphogluconate aldolase [Bacillota bacterium]